MTDIEILLGFFDELRNSDSELGVNTSRISGALVNFVDDLKASESLTKDQALIIHYFGQEYPCYKLSFISDSENEIVLGIFEAAARQLECVLTEVQEI